MPDVDTIEATRSLLNYLSSRRNATNESANPSPDQTILVSTPAATPPPAATASDIVSQLTPLTQQALTTMGVNAPPRAVGLEGNLSWFDRNQRKDEKGRIIPIDTERGIDLGEFSRMVWQRRPEDRIAVLKKMFPASIVRQADTGEPIVEVNGPGGEKRDVLVNPTGLNAADFIEAAQGAAGPTIAGTAGMLAGEALGSRVAGAPGAAIGKVAGAAIGSGIGGALTDVAARSAEGIPLDLGEIAKTQSQNAALNALWDAGAWVGAKSLRAVSPFATSRGPLQFNLEEGKRYFKDVHGIDFESTAAEESGAPILARLEKTESQLPGSSTVLGNIYKKGQEQIAAIYNAALGRRLSDEDLGRDIIGQAQSNIVKPAEDAVASARDALVKKGESEIVNTIDAISPTAATKAEAGEAIRTEFESAQKLAKSRVNAAYAAVRSIPGGSGKVLPGDAVANAADAIAKELPTAGGSVLPSGRPDTLMTFLKDMQSQRGQLMSLDELTKLKNSAYDEIKRTEAVPEVKDRWFGLVADAYDNAIDTGIAKVGDPRLRGALTIARQTYKDALLPLDRQGLSDILRTAYEPGFQAPEQLVNRLFTGARADHNYRVLQETLGASSPAFDKVRRSVLQSWLFDAQDPLTQRINPAKLESSLLGLRSAHPAIYADVVGPHEQSFFTATAALRAAGKEIKDVDPSELSALLHRGSVTQSEVQALMNAQAVRDGRLANAYLSNLATGKPVTQSPSEFVASLFNSRIDSQHLRDVISGLDPASIENLQTAALYRIATKASENNVDMAKFLAGEQSPVQAFAMAKALGPVGSLERERNEMLLGPDYLNLVQNTIKVLAPREVKTGMFKAAGSMAATGILEKLLSMPLQYLSTYAKKAVLSLGYTNPAVKKLLINTVEGPAETAAFANTLIASEPFVRSLASVYGNDAAFSIALDAKHSINRFLSQDATPTQGQSQQAELIRFLQTQKGKVKSTVKP